MMTGVRKVASSLLGHGRVLAASALLLASCSSATWTYLGRYAAWNFSSIEDHRKFPARVIRRSDAPFRYPEDPAAEERAAPYLREVSYRHDGRLRTVELDAVLAETGTTAFIVIREGGPPLETPPGTRFNYSNYSTLVLGMVLERVTGETISRYFERRIWQRMGAEYDATWSLDHEDTGLESTPSGLNARAIDFVKLGTLYLNGGRWGDQQVLPERWAAESVTPLPSELSGHSDREKRENVYYKFGWWGHALDTDRYCFFASGHLGQFIYVCPDKKLVVARFGKELG